MNRHFIAELVHELDRAHTPQSVGLPHQQRECFRQEVGCPSVVLCRPHEESAPRLAEDVPEVLGQTEPYLLANKLNAGIRASQTGTYSGSLIRGAVVGDKKFEPVFGLPQKRLNRRFDELRTVVGRHADSDKGNGEHPFSLRLCVSSSEWYVARCPNEHLWHNISLIAAHRAPAATNVFMPKTQHTMVEYQVAQVHN